MSSIGMLTSSGLWFHRKVSRGNDGGKGCVSLCTQETKNLLRLHGIVAKIPEESKCSLSYAFPTPAGFLRFSCVYPVSQRGPSGIYVGGSKVVHFTRKKEIESSDSSDSASSLISEVPSECQTFPDCGFQLPNSGVVLTCLDCFLRNGTLYCFEYGVPSAVFLAKLRGGTCTIAKSDPPEVVVHRAMYLLQNGFGHYDMFEKNCEDFALYCKTGLLPVEEPGIGTSGQASSAIGVPLAALLSTPFKLLAAGPLGMATVTAGMYCAGRYITDIGVRKDVAKVEVEKLTSHPGFRLVEDEESVNKQSEKPKTLLPMKRKRER